jgi:hypothetical protein
LTKSAKILTFILSNYLEDNRSESNNISPSERLKNEDDRKIAFVLDIDWQYWKELDGIVKDKIENHLSAVINRLCNIYGEWYDTLRPNELFN